MSEARLAGEVSPVGLASGVARAEQTRESLPAASGSFRGPIPAGGERP